MAKKRLTCDIEENLHTRLKKEAAENNQTLGVLCSSLLQKALELKSSNTFEFLDPNFYSNASLDALRSEANQLSRLKPDNWEMLVRKVNLEIVKRYKIK